MNLRILSRNDLKRQRIEMDLRPIRSSQCVVIIPSFNSGKQLAITAREALDQWNPVWVVLDGSTDGSDAALVDLKNLRSDLRVIVRPRNGGKGAAVFQGLQLAEREGYEYGLVLDADGQHPCDKIPEFFRLALLGSHSFILGTPIFGSDAPRLRVYGRWFGNFFAELETLGGGIRDSLFGFRVYPVRPSLRILEAIKTARGFDFDTELAVRLLWAGIHPVNLPIPVVYPTKQKGGISHFRYLQDNLILIRMHIMLLARTIPRLGKLLAWKFGRERVYDTL